MPRTLNLAQSWTYSAGFFLLALVAFWPTYLSKVAASSAMTHFHAVTAALWMVLLVVQAWAVGGRRFALHRTLGKASYVLAPLVLVSIAMLSHGRIQGLSGEAYALQTYILYLQLSLGAVFGLSYGLAIRARRSAPIHARFMICTALTLIDPVLIRLLFWNDHVPTWNYQWLTFGITDLVLVILIWLERSSRTGRAVFPTMLGVFVAAQLPALLGLTEGAWWQSFARWFAAL